MTKAHSVATLKQSSDLEHIEHKTCPSPFAGSDRRSQDIGSPEGPLQMRAQEHVVLQRMMENIVAQGEVNAALLHRLLEHEKRIAYLENRIHELLPRS